MSTLLRVGNARNGVDAIAYVAGEKQLEWLKGFGDTVRTVIELGDFKGKLEETILIYESSATVKRVILAGAGGNEWFGDAERLRVAVASAVKLARSKKSIKRLGVVVHEELLEKAAETAGRDTVWSVEQALVAADMANYVYSLREREEKPHILEEVRLEPGDEKAVETAKAIAEAVRVARDIANAPANRLSPEKLEEKARELASRLGLTIRVLYRSDLESLGMGGILAVGSGSNVEPRLIILEYNSGGKRIAVVGKAVVFDAGGLDLKPPQAMQEMKFDKSGGAAAIGAVVAAALLRLPVNMVALVPAVENLPSGRAYKPLDVIRMYNGTTVEIGNTDAEGRLIMADALAYAAEKYKPDYMFDFATLTGAAVVALGNHAAALFSNNDQLASMVERAAWIAGEPVWKMPLWPVYAKQLESHVADTNNVGGRPAGAITAAKFLEKFVGDRPWAHLDIAGTAWVQEKGPWKPYYEKGATGWGVRTLVEFLRLLI
ncbi:leucyl aminopeptidase [Hyperthermus butylicus]|uniref:Probable cytosol aminopeptidase n=1 Tax=Hyperthermus butylicus (strain DSM 5456 / JCM 9403 / PLM1-5) TaxID=415426 RepID=A2BK45_HYPBU|nr:leucyl aminopeptidase [Hyperthermus butylicus]ABM80356.1 Cytosol aminopeptidase [Hyperthermus butylicus DSM 5456]